MSDFSSNKLLAGIGSIIFGTIVGVILFLIGMKGISEHYKDSHIYDGLVTATICCIFGLPLFFVGMILTISILFAIIGIPLLIVGGILVFIAGKTFRRALYILSERSGEPLFHTAGTLIWIGALLSIIGIGVILVWIGFIIAGIGFLTLKETPSGTSGTYPTPPPTYNASPPPTQTSPTATTTTNAKSNFCPNCGTSVLPDATFCAHCGKQI